MRVRLGVRKGEKRASKRGIRKDMLKDERKAQNRRVSTLHKECWRKGLTLRQFQN